MWENKRINKSIRKYHLFENWFSSLKTSRLSSFDLRLDNELLLQLRLCRCSSSAPKCRNDANLFPSDARFFPRDNSSNFPRCCSHKTAGRFAKRMDRLSACHLFRKRASPRGNFLPRKPPHTPCFRGRAKKRCRHAPRSLALVLVSRSQFWTIVKTHAYHSI